MQRITHHGFHYFDAAFWVGANAVLRVSALRDIAVEDEERGHPIRRYIQGAGPSREDILAALGQSRWRILPEPVPAKDTRAEGRRTPETRKAA